MREFLGLSDFIIERLRSELQFTYEFFELPTHGWIGASVLFDGSRTLKVLTGKDDKQLGRVQCAVIQDGLVVAALGGDSLLDDERRSAFVASVNRAFFDFENVQSARNEENPDIARMFVELRYFRLSGAEPERLRSVLEALVPNAVANIVIPPRTDSMLPEVRENDVSGLAAIEARTYEAEIQFERPLAEDALVNALGCFLLGDVVNLVGKRVNLIGMGPDVEHARLGVRQY